MLIGKDVPFYEENERKSILEAYSQEEIIQLVSSLAIPFSIEFKDEDYYERFVVVFNRGVKE